MLQQFGQHHLCIGKQAGKRRKKFFFQTKISGNRSLKTFMLANIKTSKSSSLIIFKKFKRFSLIEAGASESKSTYNFLKEDQALILEDLRLAQSNFDVRCHLTSVERQK